MDADRKFLVRASGDLWEVGSTHLTGSGSGLDAGSTSIGLPLSIHLNYSVFDCQWLFDGIHKEEGRPQKCSQCENTFKQTHFLRMHMKKKHNV